MSIKSIFALTAVLLMSVANVSMASHLIVCVYCDTNGNGIIEPGIDSPYEGANAILVTITNSTGGTFGPFNSCDDSTGDQFGFGFKLPDVSDTYQISLGGIESNCIINSRTLQYVGTAIGSAVEVTNNFPLVVVVFPNNYIVQVLISQACCVPTPTPTNTPTNTPTDTPTNTPTDTPTNTPTDTPTNTPTDTPTNTPTDTPTDTPTNTPTDTPTNTPTDTPTNTPTATPTVTPTPRQEGCTPGYWKNHTAVWQVYAPNQTLEDVFNVPDSLGMDNVTLLQALQGGGGSGVTGAAQILFRAAVAALLNAAHTIVDYPDTTAQIILDVNEALVSNNRTTILNLASELDRQNNLGCPINAHGLEIN